MVHMLYNKRDVMKQTATTTAETLLISLQAKLSLLQINPSKLTTVCLYFHIVEYPTQLAVQYVFTLFPVLTSCYLKQFS